MTRLRRTVACVACIDNTPCGYGNVAVSKTLPGFACKTVTPINRCMREEQYFPLREMSFNGIKLIRYEGEKDNNFRLSKPLETFQASTFQS